MTAPSTISRDYDPDYRTPEWLVEAARELMGGIDLDPASDHEANKTVGASMIYTVNNDGLRQNWGDYGRGWTLPRVLLNPPGGLVWDFWKKLVYEWQRGHVLEAVWVGFNLDHLRYLLQLDVHPLSFHWMLPRQRLRFEKPKRPADIAKKRDNPAFPNYVTWLRENGPDQDPEADWRRFCDTFGRYGRCFRGEGGHYSGPVVEPRKKARGQRHLAGSPPSPGRDSPHGDSDWL